MTHRFQIDSASGVPFYRQIIDQVMAGMATGALPPGEQLPTVRALAVELAVNPNTVARAYKELEIRGMVVTQQGTGTFVSAVEVPRDEIEHRRRLEQLAKEILARATAEGFTLGELLATLSERETP